MRKLLILCLVSLFAVAVVTAKDTQFKVANPQLPPPVADPGKLPNDLLEHVRYEQPLDKCWEKPDANRTCSLKQQQAYSGEFTLQPHEARFATGDVLYFLEKATSDSSVVLTSEGLLTVKAGEYATSLSPDQIKSLLPDVAKWSPIVPRLADVTYVETDVWTIYNNSDKAVVGKFTCPYGCFWGDAGVPVVVKTDDALINARDLHLNKMLFTNKATIAAVAAAGETLIYPHINPANCSDVNVTKNNLTYCPGVNTYVVTWDGAAWSTQSFGFAYKDDKGALAWTDYSALLTKSVDKPV